VHSSEAETALRCALLTGVSDILSIRDRLKRREALSLSSVDHQDRASAGEKRLFFEAGSKIDSSDTSLPNQTVFCCSNLVAVLSISVNFSS